MEIRPIGEAEIPAFRRIVSRAFGGDATDDEESRQRFAEQVDLARTYTAFDDSDMVATGASFTFDVSLPGAHTAPLGGLSMVAVVPTHRRRGLLNRIMATHFDDCRQRGEPLSGLWASESSIYGRYGYADAAPIMDGSFDTRTVGVPPGPDATRLVDVETAAQLFPEVYEEVWRQRPGRLSRTAAWWEHRHMRDPEAWRDGATERRHVVAYRSGKPVGYTTYRQKSNWDDNVPNGAVMVGEVVAVDNAAALSLWSLVASVDLYPNVEFRHVPLDFDLVRQVANPRAIKRQLLDGMYVRVLDVPSALEARGYAETESLVIEVADANGIAGGVFRLDASPQGTACAPSSAEPDVTLDVASLAALYLGAPGAASLARVGKIRGDASAVRRFGALMLSDAAPCCAEVF